MATVFIPTQWLDLTGGVAQLQLDGATLREMVVVLDQQFPGIAARLCEGDGIAAGLAVSIDGAIASRGLRSPVQPTSEIHILPAIGGG
jgi:molybdopterin converting factor small subunit